MPSSLGLEHSFAVSAETPFAARDIRDMTNNNRRRAQIDPDTDLGDHVDCLNKNLANLRSDIREIIHEAVIQALRELRKPTPKVEVGYR